MHSCKVILKYSERHLLHKAAVLAKKGFEVGPFSKGLAVLKKLLHNPVQRQITKQDKSELDHFDTKGYRTERLLEGY